ncbi:MAG: biopolymer transporter ExbD [Lentisphaerae bacterium]|jgi:biopolymer transport protein ExbD|nr:biopolymer transporter ExbD [Lentisphaerota bacterium]MBT4818045.1 biopolymer transporter ExbD [Lentisphaerota bacterium]MBT5605015.1 biopolymer transporter ExbD [Lentisphaerota bacterium]MBT7054645.1 biopolymer transporter ExbD [Lentisphaerota bacterium]MBT7844674.1 biopolymer transporter ExbD [Lentisphaerota bacterium]
MKMHLPQMEEPELDVAPLIDMVFLLLVFFMATASLVKSEGDLGIRLPGMVAQAKSVDMPDEQIVEITENGTVYLNGRQFDNPATQELPQLYTTLLRYKAASDAARNEAMITIAANDNTKQQRVIDVMNACAAAGIKSVTFSAAAN